MSVNGIHNEAERIRALKSYSILDTDAEEIFDQIVRLASFICNTPISTITLIDENRQWFKAEVGLGNSGSSRDIAFCAHAVMQDEMMIVTDATKDERFARNPLVTGKPDIRFYAGIPFQSSDGYNIGTLCVIDKKPRSLTTEQKFALVVLRNQTMKLFELRKKNLELERMHEMNNRLLSIIGHDLRSPIVSMNGLLLLTETYKFSEVELKDMHHRMRRLLDGADVLLKNLLHWTKTQIEGEASVFETINLKTVLTNLVDLYDETIKTKGNSISIKEVGDHEIESDKNRIEFILRNLILNANKFTREGAVTVKTFATDDAVLVSVRDTGIGIEKERLSKILGWGSRQNTDGTSGEKGFGFGLPMCREFVESLDGKITIHSTIGKGTEVIVEVPLAKNGI